MKPTRLEASPDCTATFLEKLNTFSFPQLHRRCLSLGCLYAIFGGSSYALMQIVLLCSDAKGVVMLRCKGSCHAPMQRELLCSDAYFDKAVAEVHCPFGNLFWCWGFALKPRVYIHPLGSSWQAVHPRVFDEQLEPLTT